LNHFKLRILHHYFLFTLLSLIATLIFYFSWPNKRLIPFLTDATGYIALVLLAITLALGPLNLILKRKNPLSTYFRRDLGIYGGALALVHSVTGLFVHLPGRTWLYFLEEINNSYRIRLDKFGISNYTGLAAALIILILLVVSNDLSIEKLKALRWKNIQRFSYVMFVFIVLHSILYRVGANNNHLIYYLYLPLFLTILCLQILGIRLVLKNRPG
jgi:methionine sulfoxide reductase heme-binding subunit